MIFTPKAAPTAELLSLSRPCLRVAELSHCSWTEEKDFFGCTAQLALRSAHFSDGERCWCLKLLKKFLLCKITVTVYFYSDSYKLWQMPEKTTKTGQTVNTHKNLLNHLFFFLHIHKRTWRYPMNYAGASDGLISPLLASREWSCL